jgi:hypothetical protein
MTFKRGIAFGAVAVAFAAPAAYAQQAGGFDAADANHDNFVSRYEWSNAAAEHNRPGTAPSQAGAGSSSYAGGTAAGDQQKEALFRFLDSNGDGRIDRREFADIRIQDGSAPQSTASSAAGGASSAPERQSIPSRSIEERSKFSIPGERSAGSGASASGGSNGISVQTPPLPSRSIEERSKFSIPRDRGSR